MKKIISIAAGAALTTVLFFSVNPPTLAAADMFLKIEGIEGESTDSAHQGWIEVESVNWGGPNRSRLSRMQTSEPRMGSSGSLVITKRTDKSSANLFQYSNSGEHIPNMWVITPEKRGTEPFLKYELTDVIISSFVAGGSGGESTMMEEVTFSYRKIQWDYDKGSKDKKKDKYNIKEKD